MSSDLKSFEFKTNNPSIDARVEYMTVNHSPSTLQSGVLLFLYLRKNENESGLVFTDKATFKATVSGKTANFISQSFLSVPYIDGQKWCKVGVAVLSGFTHTKTIFSTTKCSIDLTIHGTTTGIDFGLYDKRTIELDSLYLGRVKENLLGLPEAHPSFFNDTTRVAISLSSTLSFTLKRNWDNVFQKIRYFWGNSSNDYNGFFSNSSCTDKLQSDEGIASGENDVFTISETHTCYFNALEGDVHHTELSRANEVINKGTETCVIILESYIGVTVEYLGNRVLLVDINIPSTFKPSITEKRISTINTNSIVNNWGIALQGYSKAEASCAAEQAISGDNAQIVKYEISYNNGDYSASDSLITSVFQSSGNKTFTFRATDSRGHIGETTETLEVYPYYLPQVSFEELYRCDENGTRADKGTCFYVKPLIYFASCGGNNSVSIKCSWKKATDKDFVETDCAIFTDMEKTDGKYVVVDLRLNDINLSETSSYDIVLYIQDSLVNYTETSKPLTSGKVLMHFNKGGKSIGIGMYNYQEGTCKIGYDFFVGETGFDSYIKSIMGDFITERGTIEDGIGKWANFYNDTTQYIDFNVVWHYEKYNSGKITLLGVAQINNLKPYGSGDKYTYIRPYIPKIGDSMIIDINTHRLIEVSGTSDCSNSKSTIADNNNSWLTKNGEAVSSYGYFKYIFFRSDTWNEGDLNPILNFRITAIPK